MKFGAPEVLMALGPGGLAARRWKPHGHATDFALSCLDADDALRWLPDAIGSACDALGLGGGELVDVLIMRPLSMGKVVELPPVARRLVRDLVSSHVESLFPCTVDEMAADGQRLKGCSGQLAPTMVAAIPVATLEAVVSALRGHRLRRGRVIPAPAAAAEHARMLVACGALPRDILCDMVLPGYTELVRLSGGRTTVLAPLPALSSGDRIRRSMTTMGAGETPIPSASPTVREWTLALDLCRAAARAGRVPQPLTCSMRRAKRRATRTRSAGLVAAAVVLVLAGQALRVVDTHRELAAAEAARAVIAPAVALAMRQRETLAILERSIGELTAAEAATSEWPKIFKDLAGALPEDAYATRVAGSPAALALRVKAASSERRAPREVMPTLPFQVLAGPDGNGAAEGNNWVDIIVAWRPESEDPSHPADPGGFHER